MAGGRACVLISGGIDSYACAHMLVKQNWSICGLFVDYGQVAIASERRAFQRVAATLGIEHKHVKVDFGKNFNAGEVPGRNGMLTMLAVASISKDTKIIAMGIHSGTSYYDCSSNFASRIDDLVQEYTGGLTSFFAPFLTWHKLDIIKYCLSERIDLSITYSCESGRNPPCGTCSSCLDRASIDES